MQCYIVALHKRLVSASVYAGPPPRSNLKTTSKPFLITPSAWPKPFAPLTLGAKLDLPPPLPFYSPPPHKLTGL